MSRTTKIIISVVLVILFMSLGTMAVYNLSQSDDRMSQNDGSSDHSQNGDKDEAGNGDDKGKEDDKKQEEKAESEALEEAKLLKARYDYDGALAAISEEDSEAAKNLKAEIEKEKESLVEWNDPGKFSHLFFHSLIVDPKLAFESSQAQGYKDYMVTISEFNKIIEQLHKNNYVLVNFDDFVTVNDDQSVTFKGLKLPPNKKPLILSQDDVSYYEYMEGEGFASKLVLTKDNEIKNTYEDGGKKEVGDYDMVPLLDSFVKAHPDFSYHGAKGTLALTGYNGVLGYRTSISEYGDNDKTKKEIEEAKKVAKRLVETGWQMASHSWGHLNMTQASLDHIKRDNELWQQEVAPVIGKTSILIYPFGADIADWQDYTASNEKYEYLKSQGFAIYCNVDASTPSWGQLTDAYYRNARINIDGIRFNSVLSGETDILKNFFDTQSVYDANARNQN